MDLNAILKLVNDIFIDVLDNDKIKLSPETTAKDVEEWDSLNNIQLIVAVEKRFKVRFTTTELRSWKTVGDMVCAIGEKTNA